MYETDISASNVHIRKVTEQTYNYIKGIFIPPVTMYSGLG